MTAAMADADSTPGLRVARRTTLWRSAQTLCRIVTTLLFDLKVYGKEHIPPSGGFLMVANHQSMLDPVLLGVQLRRAMSYLAKSELFENPIFSWVIRSLNAIPVRQGAGDVGALKETISRLQAGDALTIFPEGSRTEDGEMLPIEKGVSLVVRRAKVPVVPAVIDGSFNAWPKGQKFIKLRPIHILYGPPMDLAGMKPDEIVATIDRTLRALLSDLRSRR